MSLLEPTYAPLFAKFIANNKGKLRGKVTALRMVPTEFKVT